MDYMDYMDYIYASCFTYSAPPERLISRSEETLLTAIAVVFRTLLAGRIRSITA